MKNKQSYEQPTVISLFTCGMGMDAGFEKAGFQTIYANDITKFACETIRTIKKKEIKKKTLHLDEGSIFDIPSKKILDNIGLEKGEPDIIIGGPPCQSFSTAEMRKGLKDDRGKAVLEYIKKVEEIRSKAFVFENVQGIKSMAKNHMPFYDRIQVKDSELKDSQKKGSLFRYLENKFKPHPLFDDRPEIGPEVPLIIFDDAQIVEINAKKKEDDTTHYHVEVVFL